jgi:glycosyltransferase involved in cell wall biosynthesis
MADSPLVSLLIPTFNNADTVAESIESCVRQTYSNLEIILYDEASRDGTRDILSAAAARDKRIRVLTSDKNSGPVKAWRVPLHEAKGKWATFVWSDDLLLPKYVETLVAVLQDNPRHLIAGCASSVEEMLPASEPSKPATASPGSRRLQHGFPTVKLKGDEYALGILAGVFPVNQICNLWDVTAARDVFDHYINFDNPYGFDFSRHAYGNDVSFLSELGLRSGELVQVGEPLVVCRGSPKSMTVTATREHRWQFWLQYVWATRSAWRRCRNLSPRMETLIRVADDRVSLCDTMYSLKKRRWPRELNPMKIFRAAWFLRHNDRRLNKNVSPGTIQRWLAEHAGR